ncbi:MAG: flippase-like domain-containing protein [Chloroflexi bacterium]|jgi:uncharacterized membrane protein YbhN (UPF0104 family)|nr:flippase-like domain-containing protein [Chloroflexota bacterium]
MQSGKKGKLNTIIRWLGTALSLGILVWLLSKVGWKEAWETIKLLDWWRIVLVIGLVYVSRLATYLRWHALLSVQDESIADKEVLKLTFVGLFSSNFMPTTIGGDVFRLAGAVRLGVDSALATASLIADRIVGLTGMTLVLPLSIPGFVQYLKERSGSLSKVMPGSLFAIIAPSGSDGADPVGPEAEPDEVARESFIKKSLRKLKNGWQKLREIFRYWIKNPLVLLKALAFTLVHQLAVYAIISLLITGMGEKLAFYQVAGIWSLTYFITLLPISVNGIGLAEVTITNLYTTLGGISPATSIALAIILRLLWMIGSIPGAFFIGDVLAGKEKADLTEGVENEL